MQTGIHNNKNSMNRLAPNFLRQQRRVSVKANSRTRMPIPYINIQGAIFLSHWKLKLLKMPINPMIAISKNARKKETTPLNRPSQPPTSHKTDKLRTIVLINKPKSSTLEEGIPSTWQTIPHRAKTTKTGSQISQAGRLRFSRISTSIPIRMAHKTNDQR